MIYQISLKTYINAFCRPQQNRLGTHFQIYSPRVSRPWVENYVHDVDFTYQRCFGLPAEALIGVA